jgi:hypothetical protein
MTMPKLRLTARSISRTCAELCVKASLLAVDGLWWAAMLAILSFSAIEVQAQNPGSVPNRGTTRYFGGASFESIPSALSADAGFSDAEIPIAIETSPMQEEDFFRSFDSFLDADKNLNDLHQTYMRALIPYNTYSAFYLHSRDTRQERYFSIERELVMRQEMARSLKNYLLLKGIPKFLTTREETKGLGQKYATVVGQTERLTKINISNEAATTEFSGGLNPFVMKAWIRYRNRSLAFEASRYLRRENTTLASVKKDFREFSLGTYYYVESKVVEPYYFEELGKNFNYQVGMRIRTQSKDKLADLQNYIRFSYSF